MHRIINPYAKQLFLDSKFRTRYASDPYNTDVIVLSAASNATLDNEDRRPLSGYSNWFKALGNRLEGHDANILDNARFQALTLRGNRVETHTTYERFTFHDTLTGARESNNDSARHDMNKTMKGVGQ